MPTPRAKYPFPEPVSLPDRRWPDRRLATAPQWCSVDLRDGNQALPVPMNPEQKLEYFATLLRIGFRNVHAFIHHQSENFGAGMPTDLAFKLAARQATFEFLDAAIGEVHQPVTRGRGRPRPPARPRGLCASRWPAQLMPGGWTAPGSGR